MTVQIVYHPSVRNIVGRYHVKTRPLPIVRAVVSKLRGKRKGFLKLPRHERRYLIAAAIQHHAQNGIEYANIMEGRKLSFKPRYFFNTETKSTTIQ